MVSEPKTKTIVSALRCPKCGDVLFSRARHDYRSCTCGSLSVDGGFDYQKISFNPEHISGVNSLLQIEVEIPLSKEELYKDWNYSIDKWGRHNYYDISKYLLTLKG